MNPTQKLNKILEGGLIRMEADQSIPKLSAKILGVVSRDYREAGGISDFNDCLEDVLKYCDDRECDTVLFSLFTILKTHMINVTKTFKKLKHIKSLFIEVSIPEQTEPLIPE